MTDRSRGSLVVDLQGPFRFAAKLIDEFGSPFVVLELWPDVGIYLTSRKQANDFMIMLRKAKSLLPADQGPDHE